MSAYISASGGPNALLDVFLRDNQGLNPEITDTVKETLSDLFCRGFTLSSETTYPDERGRSWRALVSNQKQIFLNEDGFSLKTYLAYAEISYPSEEEIFVADFFDSSIGLQSQDDEEDNRTLLKHLFQLGCSMDGHIDLDLNTSWPQLLTQEWEPIPLEEASSLNSYLLNALQIAAEIPTRPNSPILVEMGETTEF